jgi:hypothetical protein
LALPLSDQALAILFRLQPEGDSELVFAVNGRAIGNWSRPKRRLDELAGLSAPFVIHDLRRSTVTGLARIGVDLPVNEKIVNHQSGSFRGIVSASPFRAGNARGFAALGRSYRAGRAAGAGSVSARRSAHKFRRGDFRNEAKRDMAMMTDAERPRARSLA